MRMATIDSTLSLAAFLTSLGQLRPKKPLDLWIVVIWMIFKVFWRETSAKVVLEAKLSPEPPNLL